MTLELYYFVLISFNSKLSRGKFCDFASSSDWGPGEFQVSVSNDLLKSRIMPWDGNKMHVSNVK